MIKRFASTSAAGSTYLPSVSWLIHKFKLSNDIVSTIPTSGPKKRLLKGDILAFLKKGNTASVDLDSLLRAESYHSINIHISKGSQKSVSEIGNLIAASAFSELYGKRGKSFLNDRHLISGLFPKASTSIITKQGHFGNTDFVLNVNTESKITAVTIANLKSQDNLQAAPGSFRLIDSLYLDDRFNDTVYHITQGETAVLSVSYQTNIQKQSNDILDMLGSSSFPTPESSESIPVHDSVQNRDFLDFLAPSHPALTQIQLDLTVDSRVIPNQVASAYLRQIKDNIEQNFE